MLALNQLITITLLLASPLAAVAAPSAHGPRSGRAHADIITRKQAGRPFAVERRNPEAAPAPAPAPGPGPEELYAAAQAKRSGQKVAKRSVTEFVKKDGSIGKRTCKVRPNNEAVAVSGAVSSSSSAAASSSEAPASSASAYTQAATSTWAAPSSASTTAAAWTSSAAADTWSSSSANAWSSAADSWSSTVDAAASAATSAVANVIANAGNLLVATSNECGACGATDEFPNGQETWLNCGITGSGWTPPFVSADQLIAQELTADGVFSPCADYIDQFKSEAAAAGFPAIMLASFAMQESTCNQNAIGANGEIGLMQITPANCPAGDNCYDVATNIRVGAALFKSILDANNGNVLLAIGSYNGWQAGQTESSVNSAAVCSQRQNLDYLHQFTNGWMQGKDAYSMGSFRNLAAC